MAPTERKWNEEGANFAVKSVRSGFRRGFFTILDNVLIIGESPWGEERAAWHLPHPGGLREGSGWGCENSAAADFAEALRQWYESCEKCVEIGDGPFNKSLEVNFVVALTVFF